VAKIQKYWKESELVLEGIDGGVGISLIRGVFD
jgi:hypothetical protein